MEYAGHAEKDALAVHFWQCRHCKEIYEKEWYKYFPQDCPQHMWLFAGWWHRDTQTFYEIGRHWICGMCGKHHREVVRTRGIGPKEITLDHPLIISTPSREMNRGT
jgi:rubredoxin